MAIVEEDIERVRSAVSLVDVVSPYVQLKRVGRNHVGLCPFHAERSGSFNVRDEVGRYHCFGCGASGDVFRFVQEIEHVDFVAAVEQLAAKAGVTLRYTSGGEGRDRQRRKALLEAMERAVEWYHQRLLTAPDAAAGARLPAQPGHRRRAGAASSGWAGRPTTGTRWPPGSASPSACCGTPAWPSSTGGTGCRTRSAPGCCSRSSTRPATPWPSAGGCCRGAPIRPSTRTRPRRPSTASRGCCTGSTGPRATSSRSTAWWCARATRT